MVDTKNASWNEMAASPIQIFGPNQTLFAEIVGGSVGIVYLDRDDWPLAAIKFEIKVRTFGKWCANLGVTVEVVGLTDAEGYGNIYFWDIEGIRVPCLSAGQVTTAGSMDTVSPRVYERATHFNWKIHESGTWFSCSDSN